MSAKEFYELAIGSLVITSLLAIIIYALWGVIKIVNYYKKIDRLLHKIPDHIAQDVLNRISDWLRRPGATVYDDYIKTQYFYVNEVSEGCKWAKLTM